MGILRRVSEKGGDSSRIKWVAGGLTIGFVWGTFMWLMEEIGELAAALRESPKEEIAKEFADVLAWLATIANVAGINLTEAVQMKYGQGCPGCHKMICVCADSEKP